jgi:hypothetical protein
VQGDEKACTAMALKTALFIRHKKTLTTVVNASELVDRPHKEQ